MARLGVGLRRACPVVYLLAVGSEHGGSRWDHRGVGVTGCPAFSQVLSIHDRGVHPVQEEAAGRGDGSILSTQASPRLHAWVSRDSRPLGRADTLAGREGSGTAAHFLGRARNSQGGTFDPGPCSVCVFLFSQSLSFSLACFFLTLPFLLPACLQPSPGESITKQVDALVSATNCRGWSLP